MSRIIWILAVLSSHWRRHPMQLATLLIGLISATALWSGVQALNQQARSSYDRAAATFGGARTPCFGRPQRRDLLAAALCRPAPRRLAGIPRSRRPHSDRRAVVPAIGNRTGHAADGGGQCAGDRKGRPAIFPGAAGRNTGGAGNAFRSRPAGRRVATSERRRLLPPLRVQAQLVPGVLVVDIGICPAASEKARSDFPALDRQGQRQARTARKCRRRQAPPGRAGRGERSRTPHRQLSSQPDGVRPVVLFGRVIHRQFGDRPCLRATPADAANLARLRGIRADAEHRIGDRTGIAGAGRRAWWAWSAVT